MYVQVLIIQLYSKCSAVVYLSCAHQLKVSERGNIVTSLVPRLLIYIVTMQNGLFYGNYMWMAVLFFLTE